MNKVHLPMELTQREKNLVIDYLRRYKHSPLSIKMLLCAYSGSHYRNGYISFESYLVPSINAVNRYGDSRLYSTKNTRDQWCNLFANEATEEMLALVDSAVNS